MGDPLHRQDHSHRSLPRKDSLRFIKVVNLHKICSTDSTETIEFRRWCIGLNQGNPIFVLTQQTVFFQDTDKSSEVYSVSRDYSFVGSH